MPLGVLTQTASAFGYVQGSLSWFVDAWPTLADWKATTDRLTTFSEAMARAKQEARQGCARPRPSAAGSEPGLEVRDVDVLLPNGHLLLEGVNVGIAPGQKIVLQGPSGSGKTTLFRVLAGLWPFGRGTVRLPADARVLFLPQRPYIPIGTLREALCYPDAPGAHDDREIAEALAVCQLEQLDRAAGRECQLVAHALGRRAAAPGLRTGRAGAARLAVPRRGDLGVG